VAADPFEPAGSGQRATCKTRAVAHDEALVAAALGEAKAMVLAEIERAVADRRRSGFQPLYDQLSIYPFREGKGLRPAIVISACRGVGGNTDQAIISATAVELFHNAFLVHDDVEDASDFRRGLRTMQEEFDIPTAVNVGDATNVLAISLLLENVEVLGVRKALMSVREIERMARESVEGQAIELEWIRRRHFGLGDDDYVKMAYKKTCWYTVIAPLRLGVIAGGPTGIRALTDDDLRPLVGLGFLTGVAFQIQDDVLNLVADERHYGKEQAGDLWEGKRTVMLNHFIRTAPDHERERALRVLHRDRRDKDPGEVAWLLGAMHELGSIAHGKRLATQYCERALAAYERVELFSSDGHDARFLREMLFYVVDRIK
jgi:geranylgeranyl diphosphate synthase, type II